MKTLGARQSRPPVSQACKKLAGTGTINLPEPERAGLITNLAIVSERGLEACLAKLLDRLPGSSKKPDQLARAFPYLVEVALAVFALEVTRRWRQRSTRTPRTSSRRSRFFVLNSLL